MSGVIGKFQQILRNAIPSASSAASGPQQQGPSGPPKGTTGSAPPPGSLYTDSFTASTRAAPQRNPMVTPEGGNLKGSTPAGQGATPPTVTFTSLLEKPSVSTLGSASGSVMIGPGAISGTASLEGGVQLEMLGFTLSVAGFTEQSAGFAQTPGTTTFSVEAEVGVKTELGVSVDGKRVEASVTGSVEGGVRGSYQVTLPTAAAAGITSPEQAAEQLNPFMPQNLPVGATVLLNGEAFTGTGVEVVVKFEKVFGVLGGMSTEQANGMSLAVSKLDDKTVRVTLGPTEAVSRTLEAKLGIGGISFGATDTLRVDGQLTSRQVDFDISTPEGQAAYNRFLETGELPKNDPANGTSNAATVQVASETLAREVTFGINLGEAVLDSNEYVYTVYDDGQKELQYTGMKGPATVVITENPADPSSTTYDATLTWVTSGDAESMKQSFPGATGAGDTVTFSFTPADLKELQQIARSLVQAQADMRPGFTDAPPAWIQQMAAAATPEEAFMLLMTPTANNNSGDVMARVAELGKWQFELGTGSVVLPGELTLSQH
ncbi:hypothetical protein ACLESD_30190 [Pyxidicoccus sp. 3LFB2]